MGRDNPRFHLVRGDQSLLSGDRSAARKAYAESLSVHETAGAWLRIGLLREEEGRLDQAVEAYQEALELDPEQPDALRRIGLYWLGRDEPERAIAALARASALRPGNAEIRADLERAVLTRQRNRRQGADRGG
jgi:superkiller protein 3